MTACIVPGCVVKGRHLPSCGGDGTCDCCCHASSGPFRPPCDTRGAGDGCGPHDPAKDCTGCLPSPATHGLLDGRHWDRISTAVVLAGDLVVHLRANLTPGLQDQSAGSVSRPKKRFSPPAPGDLGAIDSADAIHARLVAAVDLAAPVLGMVGPAPSPAWRTGDGWVAGLRPGSVGVESMPLAHWLWVHLEVIAGYPWVAGLVSEAGQPDGYVSLATAVHRAARAWPMTEPRARRLPSKCQRCGDRGVTSYTPRARAMPAVLTCASCAETITTAGAWKRGAQAS